MGATFGMARRKNGGAERAAGHFSSHLLQMYRSLGT